MKKHIAEKNNEDILRARFTKWIEKLLYNAKLTYIRDNQCKIETVSIETIGLGLVADPVDYFSTVEFKKDEFNFQEQRLAAAFRELPLLRKEVLRLVFVEELSTKEVAKKICCSEKYVTVLKSRAIKKLREKLTEGI